METNLRPGKRVVVLHNIPLGNLIGTIKAVYPRPRADLFEVELDGGGTSNLFEFQLQPLPDLSENT